VNKNLFVKIVLLQMASPKEVLISIPPKEKLLSISIWEATMLKIYWARNPTIGNINSCFSHH
jgi:hypothetical protein